MKVIAIVLLALVAVVSCEPVQISNNNVGDVITVGISAKAEISNTVNQDIVNVIVALLNQNADISRSAEPLAEAEASDTFIVGEPEMVDFVETFAIGDAPPAENLDESAGVISQEAFNHFVRVLPSGFQF